MPVAMIVAMIMIVVMRMVMPVIMRVVVIVIMRVPGVVVMRAAVIVPVFVDGLHAGGHSHFALRLRVERFAQSEHRCRSREREERNQPD